MKTISIAGRCLANVSGFKQEVNLPSAVAMLNKLNKLRSKSRRGDDAEASQYPRGRKLGHGTFSTVFLTTDPLTGNEGALKVRQRRRRLCG